MAQRRAVATRGKIVRAAAGEFMRSGYEGTTLARVAARAEVTLGAVSFHFPTKQALAQEVYRAGAERVFDAVAGGAHEPEEPLQELADLTRRLAVLFIDDDLALACSRLSRDDVSGAFAWADLWHPQVNRLADQACGKLGAVAGCSSDVLCFLVHCLLTGAEMWALHAGPERHTVMGRLFAAWQQAMPGGRMGD
ncbi:TetR family transcriptional regulator [Streptomyces sp. NPDC001770]